jgi:8-amino-3,8-dideoxy-alpha-D-manno-octulosonate transaminase
MFAISNDTEDMAMPDARSVQQKNLQDGMKAVSGTEGQGEPKIGIDEFLSIAERFGYSGKTISAIRSLLEKEAIGAGPFLANYYSGLAESKVDAYQRVAREVFRSKYAIGTSSGTGALHAAFVAAGVGPGTEVICPAIGFVATAAAVVLAKGVPVFCDVDRSLAIDPAKIEALITKRTVAIAPTHVMGSVCDMASIMAIARKHGLAVVEDAAQSSGATYRGKHVGTIGDLGAFSISAYKISGGGEGGLLLTSDERLWERASQVVETGGLWRPDRFAAPRYTGEIFVGSNYRMSELEAAVDVVQLAKLDATVARFRGVKHSILSRLSTYREIVPQLLNDPEGEVGYLLRFYPETHELGKIIVEALNSRGLEAGTRGPDAGPDWHLASQMYPIILRSGPTEVSCPFECPIYLERGGKAVYREDDCPVSDDLFNRMVSVKLNQWYTPEQCETAAAVLNEVFSKHCTADATAPAWM